MAEGDDGNQEIQVTSDTTAKSGSMSIEEALQQVLKKSLIHQGLVRGARECIKVLDKRQAHLCVLNESCEEKELVKLVEALCNEHKINLIKVADGKKLGEWAGLCKIDREGNPRKIISSAVVVVRDYGEESEAMNVLLDYFKSH